MVSNVCEIRVDPLQRLHTLHNLALLLGPAGDGVEGVPRTLRDGQLQVPCPQLCRLCLEKPLCVEVNRD